MKMVKVYNSDGKCVDRFSKNSARTPQGWPVSWDATVKYLNRNGYYIKGQRTDKGVKIK